MRHGDKLIMDKKQISSEVEKLKKKNIETRSLIIRNINKRQWQSLLTYDQKG